MIIVNAEEGERVDLCCEERAAVRGREVKRCSKSMAQSMRKRQRGMSQEVVDADAVEDAKGRRTGEAEDVGGEAA